MSFLVLPFILVIAISTTSEAVSTEAKKVKEGTDTKLECKSVDSCLWKNPAGQMLNFGRKSNTYDHLRYVNVIL